MASQFPHKTQQEKNGWLSLLLWSILAAVSIIVTVNLASLAVAAECQVTEEEGDTIRGMTAWKGTVSSTLPLTIIMEQNIYGRLVLPPVLEIVPYMKGSRFTWGNTVNQEIAAIGVCLRQGIRKNARFNHAMITSIDKPHAKTHKPAMKVSIFPYSGKRQVSRMRVTPLEIGISSHDQAHTSIGPVQKIKNPVLSDERSVSQSVAALPSISQPSSFGGQPFVALDPFQSALQLPDNESLRMNLTTTQALHEGNCANGCP